MRKKVFSEVEIMTATLSEYAANSGAFNILHANLADFFFLFNFSGVGNSSKQS